MTGARPRGSFNLSPDGNTLYGLTSNGGSYNDGVIFSFDVARKMITSPIQLLLACGLMPTGPGWNVFPQGGEAFKGKHGQRGLLQSDFCRAPVRNMGFLTWKTKGCASEADRPPLEKKYAVCHAARGELTAPSGGYSRLIPRCRLHSRILEPEVDASGIAQTRHAYLPPP